MNCDQEAKVVLESNQFLEVHNGTYMGTSNASSVSTKLKNLESYKKNRGTAGIKVYSGTLSN